MSKESKAQKKGEGNYNASLKRTSNPYFRKKLNKPSNSKKITFCKVGKMYEVR